MSIGKRILSGIVISTLLLANGCRATTGPQRISDTPAAAWWYVKSFEPTTDSANGIDVKQFDPAWERVSALEPEMLAGRISVEELAHYQHSGLSFSLQSNLDGDRVPEDVFVGVFSARDGGGRFVAISRDGQLLQHFTHSGPTGFSALLRHGDEIRWYKCLECSEFDSIKRSGESYFLE